MARPRPIAPEFPGNKTEERYAGHLELLRRAGEIVDYRYEAVKLRLADNTFYTADFMVLTDVVELHEVKGNWWREDARVKIKVAAHQYPWFRFLAVQWKKKDWLIERF